MSRRPAILFLCTHNAGRSQMAAGLVRHLGRDQVEVFSAGSDPGETVNPVAVEAMELIGIDISGARPRRWTDEMVRDVDVVVSMGCGDECPVYPGKQYLDWELADPAGGDLGMVIAVRDDIDERVRRLLDDLGVPTAD